MRRSGSMMYHRRAIWVIPRAYMFFHEILFNFYVGLARATYISPVLGLDHSFSSFMPQRHFRIINQLRHILPRQFFENIHGSSQEADAGILFTLRQSFLPLLVFEKLDDVLSVHFTEFLLVLPLGYGISIIFLLFVILLIDDFLTRQCLDDVLQGNDAYWAVLFLHLAFLLFVLYFPQLRHHNHVALVG